MTVRPLSLETAKQLAEWRNLSREGLRTGWTTLAQQERFYNDNFLKDYMYWEFIENVTVEDKKVPAVLAAGGFVRIEPKIRRAEIALIVHPQGRRQGFGRRCAEWILHEGFENQNFKTIRGEVYGCGNVEFWKGIWNKYKGRCSYDYNTHYWEGRYWDSTLFSIDKETYEKQTRSIPAPVRGRVVDSKDKPVCADPRIRPCDCGTPRRELRSDNWLE